MLSYETLLLVQAASTWFMTGLIWFVQVVHYPLFGAVGEQRFAAYQRQHTRRTTWVVGPVMAVELGCALLVVKVTPLEPLAWAGLMLLLAIWGSTWLLQVPRHEALERGFDARVHSGLVRTNWIRTIAWTVRAVVVAVMLWRL